MSNSKQNIALKEQVLHYAFCPDSYREPMPGRSYTSESYRFGFNGMENANDIAPGNYTTPFREIDTRLGGRWWSTDPIVKPWESPYAGFSNNPIYFADPSGLDPEEGSISDNSSANQGDINENGGVYHCDPYDASKDGYVYSIPEVTVNDKNQSGSSSSGNKNPTQTTLKKNWFQKEIEAAEIGGQYYMDNSIFYNSPKNIMKFITQGSNSKQSDKGNGLNLQMGDSNGAMSKYEAGSNKTPNEVDISILLSVLNMLPAKSAEGFLRSLPGYVSLTGDAGQAMIKVATDKQIEAKIKVQQNAAMNNEILIIKENLEYYNPYKSPSGSYWYLHDSIFRINILTNDTIEKLERFKQWTPKN